MKENSLSRQTPVKLTSSAYSYYPKSLEYSKLQNQVSLLKSKLRANRNSETRKKLYYRITVIEQDIGGFKQRLEKDQQNTKIAAEQFEKEIKQSLQVLKEREAKHKYLKEQQDDSKTVVGSKMNQNKELADKLCALEREKKDKFEQTSKAERLQRLELEEIRRLDFASDRLRAEEAALEEKQVKLTDKLSKLKSSNYSWRYKVEKEQKAIEDGGEEMKGMFKEANNHLLEYEKSMHKHLLVRDGLKEAEHKLREQTRKLQELTEMHDIETERNEIIARRTEYTVKLTETLEIPKSLEGKLEDETRRLEGLRERSAGLLEYNKQKQKLNDDVLQQMHSLVQPDELFRAYLLRNQQIKELESRYKIESYAWLGSGQPRLYDSRQKSRNFSYNVNNSQQQQLSPTRSNLLSSTYTKSALKSTLNLY